MGRYATSNLETASDPLYVCSVSVCCGFWPFSSHLLSLSLSFSLSIYTHTHRVLNTLPCSHTHTTQIPHTHTFMSAGEETRHAASLTHQGNCIAFSRADLQRRAGQDVDLCYSKPRARFSGGIRHCLFKSHGSSDPTMRQAVSVFACAVLSCLLLV